MSRNTLRDVSPFISVLLLIATLFGLVLLKMEVRRMGYSVLQASRDYSRLKDHNRMLNMEYAKVTRPENVRKYAESRLTLSDAREGQIIQLVGRRAAIPQ